MHQSNNEQQMLFGLLALQTGMVDQDQLLSAFREWSRDKSRSLGQWLVEKGAIDADQLNLIQNLVAQHLKKHGENTSKSLAALAMPSATVKGLEELQDPAIDATLNHVRSVAPSSTKLAADQDSDQTKVDVSRTYTVSSVTGQNERFRILHTHARGGLGTVSVALDTELNREVALKQILDHHADDSVSRSRFLLEAEITGGLEHPNIVPVYGLGHDSGGRPYYAMRFVRGDSFKEAVDRFHADETLKKNPDARNLELQKLLRRFLAVCDAVGYAHQRGVIHRDIKPSNIILGRHGETLLVDWGLAKALGSSDPELPPEERTLHPSSASGSSDTLPGSAIGTPAYMSPEQARGELSVIGRPTDIYSLGATLYYLLAGRPPFRGDVLVILRAVQEGAIKPIREYAKEIDPALEAICLKAMSKQPDDRYHSTRALSIELERWMADQPVVAYREPWRRRLARWERHHKGLVHGGGLVMLIAFSALAVTTAVVQSEKQATDAALGLAEARAEEAAGNFKLALDSSYEMLSMISDEQISQIPGLTRTRLALSESADRMFNRFVKADTDDVMLLKKASRVKMNLAYARAAVGDILLADDAFWEAISRETRRQQLLGPAIADEELSPGLDLRNRHLMFLEDRGLTESPLRRFREIKDLAHKDSDSLMLRLQGKPDQDLWRISHAATLELIEAHAALNTGDLKQAQTSYLRARQHWSELSATGSFWNQLYLSQAHRGLGRVAHALRDDSTADKEFQTAIAIAQRAHETSPESVDGAHVLGWTLLWNGERLASLEGRQSEAEKLLAEALAIAKKLVADFPEETRYLGLLATVEWARGRLDLARARNDDAERELLAARAGLDSLTTRREPLHLVWPVRLARVEIALAQIRQRQGRADEAKALLSAARSRLPRIQSEFPSSAELKVAIEELKQATGSP